MEHAAVDLVAEEVARALGRLNVEAVRSTYCEQNEFVYLERWLPAPLLDRVLAEVKGVRPAVHRNYIPKHKKGGSVSFYTLAEQAPTILALYRAPAFLGFLKGDHGSTRATLPRVRSARVRPLLLHRAR